MKALFICNQNINRSKTAEELFKTEFETKSAGLFNSEPLAEKELLWADVVFVMEDFQRAEIGKRFPKTYLQKGVISLDIPDVYSYGDLLLVEELKSKMMKFVELV